MGLLGAYLRKLRFRLGVLVDCNFRRPWRLTHILIYFTLLPRLHPNFFLLTPFLPNSLHWLNRHFLHLRLLHFNRHSLILPKSKIIKNIVRLNQQLFIQLTLLRFCAGVDQLIPAHSSRLVFKPLLQEFTPLLFSLLRCHFKDFTS